MNALDLLALLAFTFGAYAHGAVLFLSLAESGRRGWAAQRHGERAGGARVEGPTEAEMVGLAMMTMGFVWFVANLAMTILRIGPAVTDWPLQLIVIWLAFIYPPLIMHVTLAEIWASHREKPLPPSWRRVVWPAYLVSLLVPLWATLAFAGVVTVSERAVGVGLNVGLAAAFVTASIFSVTMSARFPRPTGTPRQRLGSRAMDLMFLVTVLVFILLPVFAFASSPSFGAIAGRSVEIAARSLPMLFLFVGAYFESRFDFFDILVKRGLALAATLAMLAGFFALALPWLRRFEGAAATWAFAIALLPIVLALPWIHQRIAKALDRRWLGRRFATVDAVTHFLSTLRPATAEPELVARAEQALGEIFGAPAAVRLDASAAPSDPAAFDVVETVPIEAPSGARGAILMGRRTSEAPYFSEDVALLESLAGVLGSVLDNLRLQATRRELSLHASRSELKALRAQINPHFLFNALNAIAGLIHRDPAKADRTVEQLADVFRYALRGAESEWTPLDAELEFVRAYLAVERARFGDRLQVEVHRDEAVRGARVPTMIVQTLVENAVKHGLAEVRATAIVRVDARADGGQLVIAVTDNGPGFAGSPGPEGPGLHDEAAGPTSSPRRPGPSGPGAPGGYGLANIRQRLHGYFGDAAALTIDRDAVRGLTTVSVALPFLGAEAADVAVAVKEVAR